MLNFRIGFWHDIGNKKIEKKHFPILQFPMKIIPVGLCLKALNSIENVLHPSETNRIENYECFQVVGFEILAKNEKNVCK